ncbi:polyketide synthase dehydratase domain-containing protein [Mycobacterium tuberculosis]
MLGDSTTGVRGHWSGGFVGSGGGRVQLPTYAFQRRRFWETPGADGPADAAGLGLGATEHALLGAVVERPDSDEVVLTGRLSLADQPWLADHVVNGVVLFPVAGFVELVIRAGDEVGCALIEELVLAAPLVMHPGVGVQVQVVVGAADESGHRAVSVYSRGDQSQGWLLNAEGMLGVAAAETPMDLSVWPPEGAESVDISDGYAQLAERGYAYGPAFQGLVAIWRRGSELFAEVVAPGEAGVAVDRMGMHPAVLDAVLHALGLAVEKTQASTETRLPFCWRVVSLHAGGAGRVRARFASAGADAISVDVCDATGLPVLTVRSLVTRPITAEQLRAAVTAAGGASDQGPLEVVWSPISVVSGGANGSAPPAPVSWADFCAGRDGEAHVVGGELEFAVAATSSVVGSVYAATHTALEVLQSWLGADRAATLVVLTHGGVGLAGEDISDPAAAAVGHGRFRAGRKSRPDRVDRHRCGGGCLVASRRRGTPAAGARRHCARPPAVPGPGVASVTGGRVGVAIGRRWWRDPGGFGDPALPGGTGTATGGAGARGGGGRRGQLPRCGGRPRDVSRPGPTAGCRRRRGGA